MKEKRGVGVWVGWFDTKQLHIIKQLAYLWSRAISIATGIQPVYTFLVLQLDRGLLNLETVYLGRLPRTCLRRNELRFISASKLMVEALTPYRAIQRKAHLLSCALGMNKYVEPYTGIYDT